LTLSLAWRASMQYWPLYPMPECDILNVLIRNNVHVVSTASISQDYWRGYKRRLGAWGTEVPQKLKLFVKLHIIFALKYNKQQLLLLLDKINLAAKYSFKNIKTTSLLKYLGALPCTSLLHKYWGTCPRPIGIDAPV